MINFCILKLSSGVTPHSIRSPSISFVHVQLCQCFRNRVSGHILMMSVKEPQYFLTHGRSNGFPSPRTAQYERRDDTPTWRIPGADRGFCPLPGVHQQSKIALAGQTQLSHLTGSHPELSLRTQSHQFENQTWKIFIGICVYIDKEYYILITKLTLVIHTRRYAYFLAL